MSIPTKAQWQGYKTQYGIPDGLSSIKMGDRFDWWIKQESAHRNARDYDACLKDIELLVKDMMTYAKALKDGKPAKFKGKTASEQQTNYKAANEKFKEIFGTVTKTKANYVTLAKPLLGVQEALRKANQKFASLKSSSPETDFSGFYSNEFRGINLPLQLLEKANTDPDIKRGIIGFKSHANMVNDMIGLHKVPFKGSDAYGHISTALSLLSGEVGGKK